MAALEGLKKRGRKLPVRLIRLPKDDRKQLEYLTSRGSMVRATSRKASTKYDLIIKARATTTKIVDISNNSVRIESNDKGQVTGKYFIS